MIDLLGMFSGICISKYIGASRTKLLSIFLIFSFFDLVCIYNEIKSVVFDTLNFERLALVLDSIFKDLGDIGNKKDQSKSNEIAIANCNALSPDEVAKVEKVFFPIKHGENSFCNWSSLRCRPEVLKGCISIFEGEKFIITLDREVSSSSVVNDALCMNLFTDYHTNSKLLFLILTFTFSFFDTLVGISDFRYSEFDERILW